MMMGRDSGQPAVAGGPAPHIPVLAPLVVDLLAVRDGAVYVDGTFGAGGHTRRILAAADTSVIGIDRDQRAIARGADLVGASSGRLTLVQERFSALDAVAHDLGYQAVDGVVLDLGVSSMQLDEAERGFSFRHDGPLDMRMSGAGPSAADVVRLASERDLAAIIVEPIVGNMGYVTPVRGFLDKNPAGGMHHLCYEVDDIIAARDRLKAEGARVLGDGEPKMGAHGKPVLFLHPKDFAGTLVELEQR